MKNRIVRLFALLLCCVLLLCACQAPPASSSSSPSASMARERHRRRTIPFGDMRYTRPDTEALNTQLAELAQRLREAEDFAAVLAIDDEANALVEDFATQASLADLYNMMDLNDAFYEEEARFLGEARVDVQLAVLAYNEVLVEGPFANDYRQHVGEHMFEAIKLDLLLSTDQVADMKKERSQLENDYNKMITTLTVTWEGEDYTWEDAMYADSFALQNQLMQAYYAQHLDSYVDIYARLVALDKEIAWTLGFVDAPTMHYLAFSRDYGPQDALAICDNVKTHAVPLMDMLLYASVDGGSIDYDATMQAMPQALKNLDPKLKTAWDFMLEFDLYDVEARAGKFGGAFATELPSYDAPFLFAGWTDDVSSLTTLIHEFGHFNDSFVHFNQSIVQCLDVSEIYSTALELLMMEQFELFTERAPQAQLALLRSTLVNAVVYQAALEEFQLRVYALDSFDAGVLGVLFAEVLEDYGLSSPELRDISGGDNSWIDVHHLFTVPFYTISYVTSGTAALQMWVQSLTSAEAAQETYFSLLNADQNQPLASLLAGAGLRGAADPAVMQEIAAAYTDAFGLGSRRPGRLVDDDPSQQAA